MFRKEFLASKEKDRNWTARDTCKMESLSLTQYIAEDREFILKLDGLDDFQKVHGFICGPNEEYRAKGKSRYPKT